jgi:hypothetical protein
VTAHRELLIQHVGEGVTVTVMSSDPSSIVGVLEEVLDDAVVLVETNPARVAQVKPWQMRVARTRHFVPLTSIGFWSPKAEYENVRDTEFAEALEDDTEGVIQARAHTLATTAKNSATWSGDDDEYLYEAWEQIVSEKEDAELYGRQD